MRWFGRVDTTDAAQPRFSWSGTGFVARFSGTALAAQLTNTGAFIFKAVVDGTPQPAFITTAGRGTYSLATGLAAGTHTVELYRQTEGAQGDSQLLGLTVAGGSLMTPPAAPGRLIEIIGDSISCGYGTLGTLGRQRLLPHREPLGHLWRRRRAHPRRRGQHRRDLGPGHLPKLRRRHDEHAADGLHPGSDQRRDPLWDFRAQPQAVIINLGTNDISNNKGDPGRRSCKPTWA